MVECLVASYTLLWVVRQEALQELHAQLRQGLEGELFSEVAHRPLNKFYLWRKNTNLFVYCLNYIWILSYTYEYDFYQFFAFLTPSSKGRFP